MPLAVTCVNITSERMTKKNSAWHGAVYQLLDQKQAAHHYLGHIGAPGYVARELRKKKNGGHHLTFRFSRVAVHLVYIFSFFVGLFGEIYLYLMALNGTSPPASHITWSGAVSLGLYLYRFPSEFALATALLPGLRVSRGQTEERWRQRLCGQVRLSLNKLQAIFTVGMC